MVMKLRFNWTDRATMLTAAGAGATSFTTHPPAIFFFSTKPRSRFNVGNISSNTTTKSSSISAAAKKGDDDSVQQQTQFSLPTLLIQSAITLFGLGFVDAGYSGDWSRIGAISKDTEELLKVLAFLVAPLCVFIIYTLSVTEKDKSD